jgi:hypothetical protein
VCCTNQKRSKNAPPNSWYCCHVELCWTLWYHAVGWSAICGTGAIELYL